MGVVVCVCGGVDGFRGGAGGVVIGFGGVCVGGVCLSALSDPGRGEVLQQLSVI